MSITLSGSSVTFGDGTSITTSADVSPFKKNSGLGVFPVGTLGIFVSSYNSGYLSLNSTLSGSYLWYPLWYGTSYSTTTNGTIYTQGSDAGGGISGDPTLPNTVFQRSFFSPAYAYATDSGNGVAFRGPGGYVSSLSGTWKALVGVPPAYSANSGSNTIHRYFHGLFIRVA